MFRPSIPAIVFAWCLACKSSGADYTVEFDCYDSSSTTGSCQHNSDVGDYGPFHTEVFSWHGWVTLGYPNGSTMQNATGKTISAIRMKVKHTGDAFKVGSLAGGTLFGEVFRKKPNATELIFNRGATGTGVADGDTFWSRVVPQSPGYPSSTPDFDGLASKQDFTDPQDHPDEWERVTLSPNHATELWQKLTSTIPREYSQIDVYGESTGSKHFVVYISRGALMAFDGQKHFRVLLNASIPKGVNRISTEEGRFVLWKNGKEIIRFSASEPPLGDELQRSLPRDDRQAK